MIEKNLYKLVLDTTWDWEYLSDSIEKKILYMTPSAEVHTGYKPEEFVCNFELLATIVHPDDSAMWAEHVAGHMCLNECISHNFLQYRIVTKSGETKWIAHVCVPFYGDDGEYIGRRVSNRDITEQKKAEDIIFDKTKRYQSALLENIPELIWLKNADGELLACNSSFVRFVGQSADEIIGRKMSEIEQYAKISKDLQDIDHIALLSKASASTQMRLTYLDGSYMWARITKSLVFNDSNEIIGIIGIASDITESKENALVSDARGRLHRFALSHSLDELLTQTINEIEALTESQIGFYHFLEEDQETLSLQAWSSRTMSDFCHADGKGSHYSVDAAGVWVDCIREKRAIIHNDYISLAHKKGLPEGHATIIRQMLIPVFRGDKIVSILGVGNKPTIYTEKDLHIATKLADLAWDIALQKKKEDDLSTLAHFDSLTLLPNRIMLTDRLQFALAYSKRVGDLVAVCVLDLDGFKPINDKYGHKTGDIVLQEVSKKLDPISKQAHHLLQTL
jgi:PAS domain S-box-containing protein